MREPIKYYLLNETTADMDVTRKNFEILQESPMVAPDGRRLFTLTFKQVLKSFGVRNWNGRIYKKDDELKALNTNPLIQTDIKNNAWCGEWGHPIMEKGMNELARQMTIFPPYTCWKIKRYWDEGNLLMGEMETLPGEFGDTLRDRMLSGTPAMASSRAAGGVDKNGYVLPGYTLVTYDAVYRPSHKEAIEVAGSAKVTEYGLPFGNSMSESAVSVNPFNSPEFANYLLSESASRNQIDMLCSTFKMEYDTMQINENSVTFTRIDEGMKSTVVIPMRQLIGAEYYNLFT